MARLAVRIPVTLRTPLFLRLNALVSLVVLVPALCLVVSLWHETHSARRVVEEAGRMGGFIHFTESTYAAVDRSVGWMAAGVVGYAGLAVAGGCMLVSGWPLAGRIRMSDNAKSTSPMTDSRAFVLAVRLLGIVFVGFGIPRLLGVVEDFSPMFESSWWLDQPGMAPVAQDARSA